MRFFAALSALCSLATALAYVGPGAVTGSTDVHDPTICKDSSNKYFLFSTAVGIAIRTSTDRTKWSYQGVVWPSGASWTAPYTGGNNENLWAPDCQYVNGQFRVRFF
jgi:arabinan endo-1,5-alpha-L-arabinosidase